MDRFFRSKSKQICHVGGVLSQHRTGVFKLDIDCGIDVILMLAEIRFVSALILV